MSYSLQSHRHECPYHLSPEQHKRGGYYVAVLPDDRGILCDCPPPPPDLGTLGGEPRPTDEPLTPDGFEGGVAGLQALVNAMKKIASVVEFEGMIEEASEKKSS